MAEYPPLPSIWNVPWELDVPWAEAWTHQLLVRAYAAGLDGYLHAPELTTGADVQRTGPPPPPCNCLYGVWEVRGAPGPYAALIDVYGVGQRWGTRCFQVSPWCPHHGLPDEFDRMPIDVLDEDERRGY